MGATLSLSIFLSGAPAHKGEKDAFHVHGGGGGRQNEGRAAPYPWSRAEAMIASLWRILQASIFSPPSM
jgi:hypothetical protein